MSDELVNISENLKQIKARIEAACRRVGRDPDDVRLIAVTKTVDTGRIEKAISLGIKELGENRVQELREKADIIKDDVRWHLIGHLQTNKVKYIIDKVSLIHSMDRIELANEVQKRAGKLGITVPVLVQVNVAGEDTKFGISPEETIEFVRYLSRMPNIKVKGLMTIAPLVENPEEVRWVFENLRKLLIDIRRERIDNIDMEHLSMGMSNDFEIAIEEGATMVRIGTAIFGRRI